MNVVKKTLALLIIIIAACPAYADEGMWALKELNKQSLARMKELGFVPSYDVLYDDTKPSLSHAVVIFGGGCTGITVSDEGLIFTNHHCGYGSIQQLSSLEHDYLKDGFISQSKEAELPVPGLSVRYLREMIDVSDRVNAVIGSIDDELTRLRTATEVCDAIVDSVGKGQFTAASVIPFYSNNRYFLVVYDVYRDVRMVFAPPSSMGKFGGDTDNWMWPRHTCDFSVFRVYAGGDNRPAEYNSANRPYRPKFVAEVSLQGYKENDFAMTVGFPGSTSRYLRSWGVEQRINDTNAPRIEVRGVKQEIWKDAMSSSDAIRIKYASKYAGSSNYWKNSIGMNRGLANLGVISRKKAEEAAFTAWVGADAARKARYGEALGLIESGYTSGSALQNAYTYMSETFVNGAEIIRLARLISSFDVKGSTAEELDIFIEDGLKPFFKNYEPELDREVLPAMLSIASDRIPPQFLPDIIAKIDKKYKGDYDRYAADLFRKTQILSLDKAVGLLRDPKGEGKIEKDPAVELATSVMLALFELRQEMAQADLAKSKGERLYLAGLQEMHPERAFYSDANSTMRASFGSIGGYRPYDAAWYTYFSTDRGIHEKADPDNDEFNVAPAILDLLRAKDFGPYGNADGSLSLCFLTNNDITGGNSGSPIFDGNARVIGLAFDGNWEAMSGDIAFEPELQRCIGVDVRFILYMIDKWGKCPRLINELKLVR
ncbi:MAG: S46 family peptidase [Tannerellaceae bacterium]|jgi:hypothetical protein|nr:S46 family peptidase [Tannerellaceae bacterium]